MSKIIFNIRSETLQIKDFHHWKYENYDLCFKCQKFPETMDHFATCLEYETETVANWRDIKLNNINRQEEIGIIIQKRMVIRESVIEKKNRWPGFYYFRLHLLQFTIVSFRNKSDLIHMLK